MTGTVRPCWKVPRREDHFTGCEVTGPKACLRTESAAKTYRVPMPNDGGNRPSTQRLAHPFGPQPDQMPQNSPHRAQTAPFTSDTTELRNIENQNPGSSTLQTPCQGRQHTARLGSWRPVSKNKNQNPELDSICLSPYWRHLSNLC